MGAECYKPEYEFKQTFSLGRAPWKRKTKMKVRTRARQRAKQYRNRKHIERYAALINKTWAYLDQGRWEDLLAPTKSPETMLGADGEEKNDESLEVRKLRSNLYMHGL